MFPALDSHVLLAELENSVIICRFTARAWFKPAVVIVAMLLQMDT